MHDCWLRRWFDLGGRNERAIAPATCAKTALTLSRNALACGPEVNESLTVQALMLAH